MKTVNFLDTLTSLCYFREKMRILFFSVLLCSFSFSAFPQEDLNATLRAQAEEYRMQGYQLQKKGDLEGALSYYQKAVEIDPGNAEAYNDIGVVYENMGDDEAALKMYQKAISVSPHCGPAYTNLALFYEKKGDREKALKYWMLRYRYGKEDDYWAEKARERLLASGKFSYLKKELLREDISVLDYSVISMKEQKRIEDIQNARSHFDMAKDFFNKGEFESALRELDVALSFNPQDKQLQMDINNFYLTVEKNYTKEKIRIYMEEAIGDIDNDDYTSAKNRIEEALSLVSGFSQK